MGYLVHKTPALKPRRVQTVTRCQPHAPGITVNGSDREHRGDPQLERGTGEHRGTGWGGQSLRA